MKINVLHDILKHSAERAPDQEAFRFQGLALTYSQLATQSSQLAGVLLTRGVKRGDRVGIYMNKALETPVAIYGILMAGAAYVPIDPSAPLERVAAMINHCDIHHLVTAHDKVSEVGRLLNDHVQLDCVVGQTGDDALFIDWDEVRSSPMVTPNKVIPEDIAYIMYTSGSTGTPKGITHTHSSGLAYAKEITDLYGIKESDKLGNHAPLHFDISLFDYFGGPLCGATTTIIPEAYTKLPASLSELMEAEKLTIWFSAPHALTQLLHKGVLDKRDLSSLRWVIFGGEPFPPKYLNALFAYWPGVKFSNSYGPAETNMCTYFHIEEPLSEISESMPIGHPWSIAETLILDEDDNISSEGELLIRSPTRMRGYWRAAELNAACFYLRGVTGDIHDVFYRTGDIVAESGVDGLRLLGRKDRQIKLRGFRIELDEIEAVLSVHNEVLEAGSFTLRNGTEIQAATTLRSDSTITEAALRLYCAEHLPHYAVPSKVHIIQTFPRTGSDKIDRRALGALFD